MPVQFAQPISQFVNPNSVEISQILRDRYLTNFAMQDELQQKLLELQTAPFAGDVAARNKLEQNINSKIQEFSNRGDYENLTMGVANLAREYQNTATPIAQNRSLYQADVEEKQKLLQAGTIKESDYEGWLKESKRRYDPTVGDYVDYTGVEFDENGRAKSGSFYTPTTIAHFVDVQGEILEQLNSLKEIKEGGRTVKEYHTIDGIEYAITEQNQIKEYVPQELVRQVTENVLNRPDVKSYMAQQARYGVIDLDDQSMTQTLLSYSAKMQNGSNQDREISTKLQQIAQQGTPGQKRKALEQAMYSSDYGRYFSMGMNARRPSVYGGGLEMEYSQAYIARLKSEEAAATGAGVLLIPGATQEFSSPLGDATKTGATEQTIAEAETKARGNSNVAVMTLLEMEGMAQKLPGAALGATTQAELLRNQFATMDAAGAYKFSQQYNVSLQTIEQVRTAVQSQNVILESAKVARQYAVEQAGYTPAIILQKAREEGGLRLGQVTTEQDRTNLAESVASSILANYKGGEVGTVYGAGSAAMGALSGAGMGSSYSTAKPERTQIDNAVTLGLVTEALLAASPGMGRADAEKYAINAITNVKSGKSTAKPSDVGRLIAKATKEVRSNYEDILRTSTMGALKLPEIYPTEGVPKQVMTQLNTIHKDKTGEHFAAATTNTGESVETLLGGPEEALNYRVDNIVLAKAKTEDGRIETMYRVKFKPTEGVDADQVPAVFIPANNMVSYLPQEAAQTMYQLSNTPADKIIDQALQKTIYTPGAASQGVVVTSQSNGYNLNFKFLPTIDQNGNVGSFDQIQMTGTTPNGQVDYIFASEQEFYETYNDLQLRLFR